MNKLKEIYEYRHMMSTLIKQDLLGKYKKSILGLLWVLINPLVQLMIYVLIFQYIFKIQIEKYPIYLFIGIMGWNLFSSSLSYGVGSIVRNYGIVKKIYFPKEILPLTVLVGNVINYFLSFPVILIGLFVSGIGISKYIVLLPVIIIIQFVFTYGITLLFSALNVFARDIEQLIGNVLFIWMYATPVVYSRDMVPGALLKIYDLNPMLHIIEAYRKILYYKESFSWGAIGYVLLLSVAILVISQLIFNKLQKRFAEEM